MVGAEVDVLAVEPLPGIVLRLDQDRSKHLLASPPFPSVKQSFPASGSLLQYFAHGDRTEDSPGACACPAATAPSAVSPAAAMT